VSISTCDDTNSTNESDGEYDCERDSDVAMGEEDEVDTVDGDDLDSEVDMERDGDYKDEEDEEEEQSEGGGSG